MRVIYERAVTFVRTKKADPSNIVVTTICCLLLLLLSCHPAISQSIIADNDVPAESPRPGLFRGLPFRIIANCRSMLPSLFAIPKS